MLYEVYAIDNLVLVTKQSKLVSVVEVIKVRTYSCKTNKLRKIYTIGRGTRNISIKKLEILTISKLKSFHLSQILDEAMPFIMNNSKKGASL